MIYISKITKKNGAHDYKQLIVKLNGCSFGEAMSIVRIKSNVNVENRTFDFVYGNFRGKMYQNNQMEMKLCTHIEIFDEEALE